MSLVRTGLEYCTNCFGWHQIKYYRIEEENREYTKCTNCGGTHDLTRQREICEELR